VRRHLSQDANVVEKNWSFEDDFSDEVSIAVAERFAYPVSDALTRPKADITERQQSPDDPNDHLLRQRHS
jgi:hypothetical protein